MIVWTDSLSPFNLWYVPYHTCVRNFFIRQRKNEFHHHLFYDAEIHLIPQSHCNAKVSATNKKPAVITHILSHSVLE